MHVKQLQGFSTEVPHNVARSEEFSIMLIHCAP